MESVSDVAFRTLSNLDENIEKKNEKQSHLMLSRSKRHAWLIYKILRGADGKHCH